MVRLAVVLGVRAHLAQSVVGGAELVVGDVEVLAFFVAASGVTGIVVAGAGDAAVCFAHVAEAEHRVAEVPVLGDAARVRGGVFDEHHRVATHEAAVLVRCRLAVDGVVVVAVALTRVERDQLAAEGFDLRRRAASHRALKRGDARARRRRSGWRRRQVDGAATATATTTATTAAAVETVFGAGVVAGGA